MLKTCINSQITVGKGNGGELMFLWDSINSLDCLVLPHVSHLKTGSLYNIFWNCEELWIYLTEIIKECNKRISLFYVSEFYLKYS